MQTSLKRFVVVLSVSLDAFTTAAAAPAPPPDPFSLLHRGRGYLLIGGGVINYLDRDVRDEVGPSGTLDLRLGLGSRRVVAGELAYVGSAGSASAFGKYLGFEGAEAVIRLQSPRQRGKWLAEPFVFGGAGWSHFEIVKATRLALRDTNDLLVVPLGAGLTLGNGPFLFDTRFTYRRTFGEGLVPRSNGSRARLQNWAVTASLGWEL